MNNNQGILGFESLFCVQISDENSNFPHQSFYCVRNKKARLKNLEVLYICHIYH